MSASASNPRYADAQRVSVLLDLLSDGKTIPFVASPDDIHAHGRALHAVALAGGFGPVADFTAPPARPSAEASLRQRVAELESRLARVETKKGVERG